MTTAVGVGVGFGDAVAVGVGDAVGVGVGEAVGVGDEVGAGPGTDATGVDGPGPYCAHAARSCLDLAPKYEARCTPNWSYSNP